MSPSDQSKPLIPYIRQSRAKEQTISLDVQRKAIRDWAKDRAKLAPEVVEGQDENGKRRNASGAKSWRERTGIGAAIAACQRGEAAGIIVAYQDRLARPTWLEEAEVWEALSEADARLVCAGEGTDFRPGDPNALDARMLFRIKAAVARGQWERHKLNWQKARESMVARGIHGGSKVPLGYAAKLDERGKRIGFELDSKAAPIVREAFLARARGESWKAIFDALEAQPATQGRLGSLQSVRLMIRNRCYTGEARSGAANVLEGAHPSIVSEGEWQAAQSQPARQALRTAHEGYLLSGLLRCDSCGLAMTADYATWRRKDGSLSKKPVYKCKAARCKARAAISRTKIENHVETVVLHTLMTKSERTTAFETPDTAELHAAVDQATADEALWRERAVAGDSPEIVMPAFEAAKARRIEAERKLAEVEIARTPSADQLERAALWQAGDPETVERLWHSLSIPNRRELVATIWPSIYIVRGTGEVHERISRRTTAAM